MLKKSRKNNSKRNIRTKSLLDKDVSTIFSKVKGTEEYLRVPKCNLKTMIRNYGSATWFVTLSPNEWLWPEFIEFLKTVNPNMKRVFQ